MRIVVIVLILYTCLSAQFPKIVNYFLDYTITDRDLDSLALCDLLILDHEVGHSRPEVLDSLRSKNPDIIMLAYIVSQEINDDATQWSGSLRKSLYEGISENWWLKNSKGEQVQFWPGTHMLNIGAGVPEKSSLQWNRYLADFICDSIIAPGKWDGVYLDNCWHSVSWLDETIDVDQDGRADRPAVADSLWEVGMNLLLDLIRERHPNIILTGNGGYRYGKKLNGALIETFPRWGEWFRLMDSYWHLEGEAPGMPVNCLNGNTENSGEISLQDMRFGLSSTLMGEGYFSYDFGADDHSQHWWFDEYDSDLGEPVEKAQKVGETILWKEHFDGDLSVDLGSWHMTTNIVDTLDYENAVMAVLSGESEWNEVVTSIDTLIADSLHVRGSCRVRVLEAQEGSELFAILRKGSDYSKDISLLTYPVYAGLDTTLSLYSDSLVVETGYRLIIGFRKAGKVLLDNLFLESDEKLMYTRRFSNGVVICNPSQRTQDIVLDREYQKLVGVQDPIHNSGERVSTVRVSGRDGIVLKLPTAVLSADHVAEKNISLQVHRGRVEISGLPRGAKYHCTLYSLQGKVLCSQKLHTGQLDLSHIGQGRYLLSLSAPDSKEHIWQRLLLK